MKKVIAYKTKEGKLISREEAERIQEIGENGPLSDGEKAYELKIKKFKEKVHEVFDVPDANVAKTIEDLAEVEECEDGFIEEILDNIPELHSFACFDEFVDIIRDLLFGYTDEVEKLLDFVKDTVWDSPVEDE